MFVYSEKIVEFIEIIRFQIKEILSKELKRKVFKDRFYSEDQRYHYPINVVIYNNRSMLGYFDGEFNELGFHERLMHVRSDQLSNIIRHELAHYLCFIKYGYEILPHGVVFKQFCESVGWNSEVSAATICLDDSDQACNGENSGIFRKIQKLMALATSSNSHEAEMAMIKSQQLLLKHNIETESLGREIGLHMNPDDKEKVFLKRLLKRKKADAKMQAIAHILSTFFVNTVYNHSRDYTYLEIVGSLVNLEIAEYVSEILETQLEWLWNQAKQEHCLKGLVAKNSFFLGIARGYCAKIEAIQSTYSQDVNNALMVIEKKVDSAKSLVYPHLTKRKSARKYCPDSAALGVMVGKKLHFNPAINRASQNLGLFIGHVGKN